MRIWPFNLLASVAALQSITVARDRGPQPPADRLAPARRGDDVAVHHFRHRKTPYRVNVPIRVMTVSPPLSRYMPHQGKREIARRQRQEARRG
jgi:hypothetical protein